MMKNNKQLLAYFSHHKCATAWVNNIIASICKDIGLKFMIFDNPSSFNYDLKRYVEENNIDFLSYTNADYRYVDSLKNFKGFHVIRDPRDICVSAYFAHRYSDTIYNHPKFEEHRDKLRKLSKADGLFLEIKACKEIFEHLYNWNYSLSNVIEIKMEDLVQDPRHGFIQIFRFLDFLDETNFTIINRISYSLISIMNRLYQKSNGFMPFHFILHKTPCKELLNKVYKKQFVKLSNSRIPGTEGINSHYRKGITGDWVNHFSKRHIEFFKEHYNELLMKLGYESGYNR